MTSIDPLVVLSALRDDPRFSAAEKVIISGIYRELKEAKERFSELFVNKIIEREKATDKKVKMVHIDQEHENMFAKEILGVHGQLGLSASERPRDLFPHTLYGYNVTWGAKEFRVE